MAGSSQGDAIRNITGRAYLTYQSGDSGTAILRTASATGAIRASASVQSVRTVSVASTEEFTGSTPYGLSLDVSKVVPTSTENRALNTAFSPRVYR